MPDCTYPRIPDSAAWHAQLHLRFEDDGGTTRLTGRAHSGPLRVQKPLYPEGPRICHAIVIHPPGGIVGGDQLAITAEGARRATLSLLLLARPSGTGPTAISRPSKCAWRAAARSVIEWMPQEAIFSTGRKCAWCTRSNWRRTRYIGCEILCFGRSASGERYAHGQVAQRTSIRCGGKLLWWEQGVLHGGGAAMHSATGLGGATVCATLTAVGALPLTALMGAVRAIDPALAATQIKSVFCARLLCADSEQARRVMTRVWQALRPHLLGCAAPVPRIWNT
ncbi:urease accessory protein UreD [Massilia sp. B-10]|nr:urease accessory protein UreD [Massilia sp. B-10]